MTRDHGLQTHATTLSLRPSGRPVIPVLIEVPTLSWAEASRHSGRASHRKRPRPVRRRRLRREVRITGYALLTALPLAVATLMLWGDRPAASALAKRDGLVDWPSKPRPPAISISIEPAALLPYAEVEPPVVFPGYLLPDDGTEEASHAGG